MFARAILVTLALLIPSLAAAQAVVTTEMVSMRDGTRLATDVYLSPSWTSGPTIFVRTTYNKDGLSDLGHSLGGYGFFAVVIQDTRGRFASEGIDTIFQDDATDGADSMAWLLAQTWSDGQVGTLGGSALGITQYLLAGSGPDGLACQWVDVATPDMYAHAMFPGGTFRKAMVENWLSGQGSLHMLPEIEAHPMLDEYWAPVRLEGLYGNVDWPAMHFGGWYDIFLQGTIEAFQRFDSQGGPNATGTQKMVLGPWTHGAYFSRDQGQLTYPVDAALNEGSYGAAQLDWFNWCLKGHSTGADTWPAVLYYLMGDVDDPDGPGNEWRDSDSWPPPESAEQAWYLHPDGVLSPSGPSAQSLSASIVSDPADPVPSVCGANLTMAAGPCDQAPQVESRPDVLVFSSAVLPSAVEIAGRVWARLFFSADVPDCDLAVRLSDVYPDGRSMLVLDGILRARHRDGFEAESLLESGQVYEGFVDLWSTAIAFAPGHRIRISISGSNAPRFDPNPQTGEAFRQHTELRPGTLNLHLGPNTQSALLLPVLSADPDPDAGPQDGDVQDGGTDDGGLEDGASADGTPDDGGSDAGADGGPADEDPQDAGSDQDPDDDSPGGDETVEPDPGCACDTSNKPHSGVWPLLILLVISGLARRKNLL
jgi:MYXO-CTERM domain-containing protein